MAKDAASVGFLHRRERDAVSAAATAVKPWQVDVVFVSDAAEERRIAGDYAISSKASRQSLRA